MNVQRILELAADLRAEALPPVDSPIGPICPHFAMRLYVNVPADIGGDALEPVTNWCGTTCCLAGLAVLKWDPEGSLVRGLHSGRFYLNNAMHLLELDPDQATQLFVPDDEGIDVGDIGNDKLWAARCLEKLAATGIVDWKGTRTL